MNPLPVFLHPGQIQAGRAKSLEKPHAPWRLSKDWDSLLYVEDLSASVTSMEYIHPSSRSLKNRIPVYSLSADNSVGVDNLYRSRLFTEIFLWALTPEPYLLLHPTKHYALPRRGHEVPNEIWLHRVAGDPPITFGVRMNVRSQDGGIRLSLQPAEFTIFDPSRRPSVDSVASDVLRGRRLDLIVYHDAWAMEVARVHEEALLSGVVQNTDAGMHWEWASRFDPERVEPVCCGLPFRGSNGDWRTYALPSADQFFV